MPYSSTALDHLQQRLREMPVKAAALREAYVLRSYSNSRSREYAFNGFGRRLNILQRCIENVFAILPPEQRELPAREQLFDADIQLHAFVFNTFGALDNLAWIWVWERLSGGVRPREVSLNRQGARLRNSFSAEFQAYLADLTPWFAHQENYRHALAHRIPLYVPPFAVPSDRQGEYESLGKRIHDAITCRDFAECDRLEAAQQELAFFEPHMIHSFEERSSPVAFHYQILGDFLTIEEIALKMLSELNNASAIGVTSADCIGPQ